MNVIQFLSSHTIILCVAFCISLGLFNLKQFILEEIQLTNYLINPLKSITGYQFSKRKTSLSLNIRLWFQRFLLFVGSKSILTITFLAALISIIGNLMQVK